MKVITAWRQDFVHSDRKPWSIPSSSEITIEAVVGDDRTCVVYNSMIDSPIWMIPCVKREEKVFIREICRMSNEDAVLSVQAVVQSSWS